MSKSDLHKKLKKYNVTYTWGGPRQCGTVGEGWHALVINAVEKMIALGWDGKITQIKEKFGGLRFYISSASEDVLKVASAAEDESFKTCETCGSTNDDVKKGVGGGRWLKTFCPPCRNQYELKRGLLE